MRKLTWISFMVALTAIATIGIIAKQTPVYAQSPTLTAKSNYDIAGDGFGVVTHELTLSNSDSSLDEALYIPANGTDISDIVIKEGDSQLPATLEQKGEKIKVVLPAKARTAGASWNLRIMYRSKLVNDLGSSKAVQISPLTLEKFSATSQELVISADLAFGFGIVRGDAPVDKTIKAGKQLFIFKKDDGPLSNTVSILFGDKSVVEVNYNTTLKNDGWWWKTLTLALPPDTNQQRTFVKSVDPRPSSMRLDSDGNILAEYKIGPKKSVDVTAQVLLTVSNLTYDLSPEKQVSDIDSVFTDRYTKKTDKWRPDSISVDYGDKSAVKDIVSAAYNTVRREATEIVNDGLSTNERSGALTPVDKLIGALRAKGVPARAVIGKVATDGQKLVNDTRTHAWAEAYIPGTGWVTLDPVLGKNSDNFGAADVLHIGLALWGVRDDFPPVNFDASTLKYVNIDAPQPNLSDASLRATKYQILPGVGVLSISSTLPAGNVVDNAGVANGSFTRLGSLAPFQTSTVRAIALLSGAYSRDEIKFGIASSDNTLTEEFATTQVKLNFIPMIALAVIGAVLIAIFIVRRRTNHRNGSSEYRPNTVTSYDENTVSNNHFEPNEIERVKDQAAPAAQTIDRQESLIHPNTGNPRPARVTSRPASRQPRHPRHRLIQ